MHADGEHVPVVGYHTEQVTHDGCDEVPQEHPAQIVLGGILEIRIFHVLRHDEKVDNHVDQERNLNDAKGDDLPITKLY